MKSNLKNRTIYNKDNLEILKGINSNSIDLIYLDPPFNKNKVFSAPIGSSAEGASFNDLFREEDVKEEWVQDIKEDYEGVYKFLSNIKELSNITQSKKNKHYLYNYCYLCYMAIRILEMRRILKDTGSLYLHCDNTMGHYLKILLDIIFGEKNFRNEIIWHYGGGNDRKLGFNKKHDCIYLYSKSNHWQFNNIYTPFKENTIKRFNKEDEKGKYKINKLKDGRVYKTYMKEKGKKINDVWYINIIVSSHIEHKGYPTQKPIALLERIIKASSNEGDIVLDPFCGCATTCVASEKLGRQWVGIDISVEAYNLVKERLRDEVADPENLLQYDKEIIFKTDPPKRTDTNGDDGIIKKYVYIISHPKHKGFYKVGIASDYKARLNSYQTSDPLRQYKLEYQILTSHFRELEKHIHDVFDNLMEWVKASKEQIIKEIEEFLKKNKI